MNPRITGLFAALVTPFREDGGPDYEVFEDLVDFVMERGPNGICIGGGTSEYPALDLGERKELMSRAARRLGGRGPLICAVGAATSERVVQLANHAKNVGAIAVLIPMPHFYHYDQRDLESFCRKMCTTIELPCLLYNLPQFTSGLELETTVRLLLTAQNVCGIKDSSGDKRAIGRLSLAREQSDFSLLIGQDALISPALLSGWDGVISGTACVFPELLAELYVKSRARDRAESESCQNRLNQLLEKTDELPFPWGIKAGLGVRGFPTGPMSLPLTPLRKQQLMQFREWLRGWMDSLPLVR